MRGQLIGQIFIYIITLVLVTFLLIYGYRAITTFKDKAEQISYIQFKNEIENTIEVLTVDFGSVKVKDFVVPEKINTVCFVTNYPSLPTLSNTKYPIIEDSVNSGVNKNVFLIGKNVENSFSVGKISSDEDLFCFPVVDNRIRIRLEGKGDHTFIST